MADWVDFKYNGDQEGEAGTAAAAPTWGDYLDSTIAGVHNVRTLINSGMRYLSEKADAPEDHARYYKDLSTLSRADSEARVEGMTEGGRRLLQAAISSEDFWSRPFAATFLKAANTTPTMAATIIPALLLPGAGAATAGAALIGGGMTAAEVIDGIYEKVDSTSDADLQTADPYYASLRELGLPEDQARKQYTERIRGLRPAIAFAIGVGTNAMGPAGAAVRGAKGASAALTGAGRGRLANTARAMGEGVVSEGIEEGAGNALTQTALQEGGLQKEFDYGKLADATLEGALLGGVFGAAAGGAGRPNRPGGPQPQVQPVRDNIEVVEDKTPAAAEKQALQASAVTSTGNLVPDNVAQASENLKKADPLAGIQTQGGGGGQVERSPRPPETGVPDNVAQASQRLAETAPAPEPVAPVADPVADPVAAPVEATPVEAGPRVLKPVGEEEAAPEMVEKVRTKFTPEQADKAYVELDKKKGDTGSKDTQKLAKRQEDAAKAKFVFDELPVDIELPKTEAGRQKLAKRLKAIVDGLDAEGVEIPARTGYKDSKNPTPDHLVWARDIKDLVSVLTKKALKAEARADRDARVTSTLLNWKIAKETGDFAPMREERISAGAMAKSKAKGGATDSIVAPVKAEEAAETDDAAFEARQGSIEAPSAEAAEGFVVEKDNDAVQTGRVHTRGGETPSSAGARLIEGNKFDKEKGEWVTEAAPVRKVAITDELRRKYEQPAVSPKAEVTPEGKTPEKAPKKAGTEKVNEIKKVAKARTGAKIKAVQSKVAKKAETAPAASPAEVKSASPLEKIKAARAKVNTEPSPAQKESGNYAKGHVNIQGLDITIENPKGSKRSGKTPTGATWEVTMPADYGYVKRTEGADGDQVDVYMGDKPDSPHVFVIDQLDLKTNKFDEHKVMLGFDDPAKVYETYDRGFSDGKGFDRIGKITPMTMEEFRVWLAKGDTKAPAADLLPVEVQQQQQAAPGDIELTDDEIREVIKELHGWDVRHGYGKLVSDDLGESYTYNGRTVRALYTGTADEFLSELVVGRTKSPTSPLMPLVKKRLRHFAGDTKVHYVSPEDMHTLSIGQRGSEYPAGFYSARDHVIVIDVSQLGDRKWATQLVMHEVVHAATSRALDARPKVRVDIERLMLAAKSNPFLAADAYGLQDAHEFLAEAFTNPDFQVKLGETPLDPTLARELNLGGKTYYSAVLEFIRRLLGLPRKAISVLDAAFEVGDWVMREQKRRGFDPSTKSPNTPQRAMLQHVATDIKNVFTRAAKQEQQGSPKLLKLATWNQMASIAERFFPNNPVKRLYDLREARRVRAERILRDSEPLTHRHVELERKYKGEVWDNYTHLVHDETYAGVFADKTLEQNSHLGKETLDGAWSKAQHARLAAMYAKLPEDLRALRRDTMKYYTDQQNQMSLDIIKNRVLVALGIDDASMAQRIFDETHTEADIKAVGGKRVMDLILQAGALKKIKGPYFPLMRHGGYVVQGLYKIAPAITSKGNGKLVAGTENVFEFTDRDAALEYAQQQDARPTVKSVWVDESTGLTYGTEDDGTQVRITSKDTVAEQRWRVTVQDKHVEFFATESEARRAAQELEHPSDGKPSAFRKVMGVEHKRFEAGDMKSDMLASDIRKLKEGLERRKQSGFTPHQMHELGRALDEASIRFMGSTHIQSRRLPRTYVAGASKDLTRVLWEYANSSSGYVAKLEYAPRMEATLKEIVEHSKGDAAKDTSLGRSAIANEIERRIRTDDVRHVGFIHTAAQRLMTVSFIDKLASPAYSMVNSLQAAIVGMPVLAGRHGVGASVSELTKAYNDIAGFSIIKQSLGEVGRAAKGEHHQATYLADIKRRMKGGELKLFERLEELGTIDADAGLELGELARAQAGNTVTSRVMARADAGLGYIENIARQMPKAIETINRSVMALSAYRLEMRKSGNHDKAVAYAQKVVDETQFNYSNTNAPPIMNHPLAKLSFQFKKYGQAMYYLLGSQVGKAYRGGSHGERAEALKTLGLIATTHMAVAGALGLPTEPIKYLLMGAKAFGFMATGWDDVEEIVRKYAADTLGKTGGEIFSKGLPRALGLDVSSRMGLDSLVAFGEPKSDKEADVKKWLFDTLAGAPAALMSDYVKGANYLASGDVVRAAELMVPIKVAADSIRAYRQSTEGKKAETGRLLAEPYSAYEAGLRVAGFTPAREAEEGAKAAAFRNQTSKAQAERSKVVNAWVNAKGADKVKAQRAVQDFNRTARPEQRITSKDLKNAASRREREGTGIITNRRTEATRERLEQIYQ